MNPARPAVLRRNLLATASLQAGYFTTGQAEEAGYQRPNFTKHVAAGSWEAVARGIYRLRDWPDQPDEALIFWHLWSQGVAVVSHQSAIRYWDVGVISAHQVHLTVAPGFRRLLPEAVAPPVLHRAQLADRDWTHARNGYRVTTILRTVLDLVPEVDADHLARTIEEAEDRHLLDEQELRSALTTQPEETSSRLQALLDHLHSGPRPT